MMRDTVYQNTFFVCSDLVKFVKNTLIWLFFKSNLLSILKKDWRQSAAGQTKKKNGLKMTQQYFSLTHFFVRWLSTRGLGSSYKLFFFFPPPFCFPSLSAQTKDPIFFFFKSHRTPFPHSPKPFSSKNRLLLLYPKDREIIHSSEKKRPCFFFSVCSPRQNDIRVPHVFAERHFFEKGNSYTAGSVR